MMATLDSDPCLHLFEHPICDTALPERFTFVFYYEPHPLCVRAAEQLQTQYLSAPNWVHNFGLTGQLDGAIGKMFGVLLVRDKHGQIGFLAGFSGKLANCNHLDGFVPPVFDLLDENSFFLQSQLYINRLNTQLEQLQNDPKLSALREQLQRVEQQSEQEIAAHKALMAKDKQQRKIQRLDANGLEPEAQRELTRQLDQRSISQKLKLRDLKLNWQQQIEHISSQLQILEQAVTQLQQQRKTESAALQQKIFEQYQFLNRDQQLKSLAEIFSPLDNPTPPAGAGECAAPKLLHYAFKQGMTPLALAEFWWGASPKSEVRQHKNYYPACMSKCQPILSHMLSGIAVDPNPLIVNTAKGKPLPIVYQDEEMVVVNKPAEFLSVPGKTITDSVQTRIAQLFPQASGPLIVHRLDMSTSGLMVIALNKRAHQRLQRQFIERTVKKRYVALLDGSLAVQQGEISLPLRVDLADRPRQLVCTEHGKHALTYFEVIGIEKGLTRVHLYPHTGRTHQLRVHCAHHLGLNSPIKGDDLYGKKALRLHLHAEQLVLKHPLNGIELTFCVEAEF
ncbi:RNA pseudouridine synthase [Pseudoalteromonas ulvae]|uniref:RNA pseudouridine synthase n=2 Tax=Pseudoalteromonas ulvae TaxID=107327 RepID=A0A244CLX9_PSEDV|nr:RNA pseudouridine synthase [Pseudoalteromonas ulvae]